MAFTSRVSLSLRQGDMGRMLCRNIFGALISEFRQVDAAKKVLPGAEKDRGDGEVQLVDEPGVWNGCRNTFNHVQPAPVARDVPG